MKRYNIIMLIDVSGESVLMCRRCRPPYQGLYNLVGGKAEEGEDGLHAAYRELREETGVTAADVTLTHLATFSYPIGGAGLPPYELQTYGGRLRRAISVRGDENPLLWMPLTEDFFDLEKYAGEGSIGHVVESVRRYRPGLLEPHTPEIALESLCEADLPVIAYYIHAVPETLVPMLTASRARLHENRYYEVFAVRTGGCTVGMLSLREQPDGTVSIGVDTFAPFRRCGFAFRAMQLLTDSARRQGYTVLTAQIRTNNAASIALHMKLGFMCGAPWVNRKGNEVCTWRKEL